MSKKIGLIAALLTVSSSKVWANAEFWRDTATSAGISASFYMTSNRDRKVIMTQDEASSYIASNGAIRGPFLEAAFAKIRLANPSLTASDLDLAISLLAQP